MKARPFLAVVLASLMALLAIAGTAWWWVLAHSPLQLQHQSLAMPLAARFVPRQAPLSLFVFSDGRQLEGYARAVAPSRQRRQAVAAVAALRDGAFAAAGLDYASELAGWLAPETGLALLADSADAPPNGWLLSLRSRDPEGARRFVQRFWQTRSLAGTDLQVSSYRGMGLISGRGGLVGQPSQPLATALINDDLVLIASGRGVLEQALDVSQIDELNQAANPAFQASLRELGQGVALISARPQALEPWFWPGTTGVVAALRPEGATLTVEARIELADGATAGPAAIPPATPDGPAAASLLQAYRGDADSLALLQSPADWGLPLQALLQRVLAAESGSMPALVAAADHGPLLWAQGPLGWQLGSPAHNPDPEQLQDTLRAAGLVEAPLQLQGQTVQVWTRLAAITPAAVRKQRGDSDPSLQATLLGAHTLPAAGGADTPVWWAQTLAVLAEQLQQRQPPRQRLNQLEALGAPQALLRWAVAGAPARELLQQWQPWQLLSGLAGQPLGEAAQGLALAVEPDGGQLLLKARLQFDG